MVVTTGLHGDQDPIVPGAIHMHTKWQSLSQKLAIRAMSVIILFFYFIKLVFEDCVKIMGRRRLSKNAMQMLHVWNSVKWPFWYPKVCKTYLKFYLILTPFLDNPFFSPKEISKLCLFSIQRWSYFWGGKKEKETHSWNGFFVCVAKSNYLGRDIPFCGVKARWKVIGMSICKNEYLQNLPNFDVVTTSTVTFSASVDVHFR